VQRACKLFLAGLCPHDVFSKTKLDMGPCRGVHDDGLKEVSVLNLNFPSHFQVHPLNPLRSARSLTPASRWYQEYDKYRSIGGAALGYEKELERSLKEHIVEVDKKIQRGHKVTLLTRITRRRKSVRIIAREAAIPRPR
jgi:hypothetical protein